MQITATNIRWDTTTDDDDTAAIADTLPTTMTVEVDVDPTASQDEICDAALDALSDATGWCVQSCDLPSARELTATAP